MGFKGGSDNLTKLTVESTVTLKEQANADSDTAGYGQLWVKSNTPCDLYFTDDTGQDVRLTNDGSAVGSGGGSARSVAGDTDNGIITWVTSDNTFASEANFTYDGTDLAVTCDTATFTSANSTDPLIIIKNTTSDANGARLQFVKDKGAAGADGDDIGVIEFVGDDAGQAQTTFAKIVAEVSEADNTDEAGKLSFFVAESDGTTTELTAGLVLEGEHATDGQVDVTIGAGADSLTTIAGDLDIPNGGFALGSDASGDMYYRNASGVLTRIAVGSDNHVLTLDGAVPGWEAASGGSPKANDISTGDAAVNIVTTSGNITLDAQDDDADIIFKVDDNGSAVTALTLDGSDEGNAIFVNDLKLQSDSAAIHFGTNNDIVLTHEADRGLILTQATETTAEPVFTIKNTGDLASGGGIEFLLDNGAGEGDDDILGFVSFKGDDSGDGATQFAKLEVLSSDITDGDEAGKFVFSAMAGGTAGTAAMTELLSIGGEDTANSTHCAVVINEGQIDCDFRVESNWYTHLLFCDANNNGIGIMNDSPVTSFDVINDYQSTTFENKIGTSNIGGGKKIIYSPGANDTLTKGQLYFLHTDGTWDQTDADAVATGASQLLGVPAVGGASQTYPMILEGYIRVPSSEIKNVPGSGAVDGLPVYVSTEAGHFDFTAPSGTGDFVRIVGYAIDDDSGDVLIYFNPEKSWVEIA